MGDQEEQYLRDRLERIKRQSKSSTWQWKDIGQKKSEKTDEK